MIFYDAEIVFTGLCFFCFAGSDPACPENLNTDFVYIVNAWDEQDVCQRRLHGGHLPFLTFDSRFLEYADATLYELIPSPEGKQLAIVPLAELLDEGPFDICFREECVGSGPCRETWPTPTQTADAWPGLGREQDTVKQQTPKFYKPDANHVGWLPYVPEVEPRCSHELRDEVADLDQDFVWGRVRLDWGTLSTGDHARRPRKFMSKPYAVWGPPQQAHHMPKAFAGSVSLNLRWLRGPLLIQTGCAVGDTPRTLFRLKGSPFRPLKIHVSNSPLHDVDPLGRTAQDHFRWYYRLFERYEPSAANPNSYECPDDVTIPEMMPAMSKLAWLKGVINVNVLCPPAGMK